MRKLFDQLTTTLQDFRNQRDNLILLVASGDTDVALVLKALRELDRNSSSDLYFLSTNDFESADSFVQGFADQLRAEHAITNESVGPHEDALPPLPVELLDAKQGAAERLIAGLGYARSLIVPDRGQKYILGLGPMAIRDPDGYLKLLSRLVTGPAIQPWMRGGRIVARVPIDFDLTRSPLAKARRVAWTRFVIPPDAHELELAAAASDPQVPMLDRMQAEVQLAYLDSAHSRYDKALERFEKALAFFQWAAMPEMEGLILCGLGDIARRQDNWNLAQQQYACAVVPIAESGSPMLLATVVQNLAVVAFQQESWEDAEQRYAELAEIKRGMFDEIGLVEALEWRAECQKKLDAYDRAVQSWEEAALICQAFEMSDRIGPTLSHLRDGYSRLNMFEQLDNFELAWGRGNGAVIR